MLQIVDTHCHVHEESYPDALESIQEAQEQGIKAFICVGTDLESSKKAVEFAKEHKDKGAYASIGIHPHEAVSEKIEANLSQELWAEMTQLAKEPEVVAIGEFGFDFFYHKADELLENQKALALKHLELAQAVDKPLILHIREAFEPFFEVIKDFPDLCGVIHSFSDSPEKLKKVLALPNNFYIGLNGIMTFSKNPQQLQSAQNVPLDRLVLETDSPYLTPVPLRGKMNSIKNTLLVAEFLSNLRGEDIKELAEATTANSKKLFKL